MGGFKNISELTAETPLTTELDPNHEILEPDEINLDNDDVWLSWVNEEFEIKGHKFLNFGFKMSKN